MCPAAPAPVFVPLLIKESPGMAMNVQKNIISLGVDCDIITNQNWEQITKTRYVHQNTNHFFLRVDEGDDKFYSCNINEIEFSKYDIIVISDYDKGFLCKEDISNIASMHECVFMDTKKELGPWCRDIKYIKINNFEFERSRNLMGEEMKRKTIVTLGKKGCMLAHTIYPVDEVEIKDLSGSGDTFMAGLVVEYSRTKSIESSVVFANECATKVVQRRGVSIV
jgi:bifunctional ADP-heptose synthase (sugar kinase/adenylyltransferase)